MFFKRKKRKKRVICGSATLIAALQEWVDEDITTEMDIMYNGEKHEIGTRSDFDLEFTGKKDKETGKWANLRFFFDEQEFDTMEQFKEYIYEMLPGKIEVLLVCGDLPTIHSIFDNYIVEDAAE